MLIKNSYTPITHHYSFNLRGRASEARLVPSGCPQLVGPDTPDASDAPEAPEGPSQAGTNKSHHIVDKGPVMQGRESRILIFNLGPWPCQWRDLGCDQRKHEACGAHDFHLDGITSINPT